MAGFMRLPKTMVILSIILLILVTVVWGSTFFLVKDTVTRVDEFHIVFFRNLLAAFPMVIVALLRGKGAMFSRGSIGRGAMLGFLLAATYLAQTIGLKFTSSGHSAFITGAAVVLVPVILYAFWKTRLFSRDILSILIVFAGLFLLTYDFKTRVNVGDLITLITMIAYAFSLVLAGRYVLNTEVLSLIAYQFVFAAAFSGIAGLLVGAETPMPLSGKSIVSVVYLGIIGTLFCYFVSVWAQKYVSSLQVALIFALEPVFAVIFAYFFGNEGIHAKEVAGMALILSGIIIYQKGSMNRAVRDARKATEPSSVSDFRPTHC